MEERPRYFVLLILSIVIASSIYMSWSTDRAQGRAIYSSITIEVEGPIPFTTSEVSFELFKPRPSGYFAPYPVVLTTHGICGSKEMMYAFNIELARRNFTVVSVDLPGHGESVESFEYSDFTRMAEVCYAALEYVWETNTDVENSTYGIVAGSLGVGVAFAMTEMEVSPSTIVAIGSTGDLGFGEPTEFDGNLLYAIGSIDELVSQEEAIDALRDRTSDSSAEPQVTYGDLSNENATRLVFGNTNHLFSMVDTVIVNETVFWMIESLQGATQLNRTIPTWDLIFQMKTYATFTGTAALILSIFPVMLITNSFVKRFLHLEKEEDSHLTREQGFTLSLGIGGIFGTSFMILPITYIFFGVMSSGLSPFSLIIGMLSLSLLTFILAVYFLRDVSKLTIIPNLFSMLNIDFDTKSLKLRKVIIGSIVGLVSWIWLSFWISFGKWSGGFEPMLLYTLARQLPIEKLAIAIILSTVAIPYFVIDTLWIRGFLMRYKEGNDWFSLLRRTGWVYICRITGVSIALLLGLFLITNIGIMTGPYHLMSIFYLIYFGMTLITPAITIWSDHIKTNYWTPIVLNSVLFAWVLVTILPMV